MGASNYRDAGVDTSAGEAFAEHIRSINSPAIPAGLGGFAGAIPLDLQNVRKPVLLSTTDGVGTKLLVARELDRYDTIGIDLVAMCVNDLAVCGAAPLSFLDYIACGALDRSRLDAIMAGIVRGCERAGTTLAGGETAELPDMYERDAFDLAGFAVGIVDEEKMLPRTAAIHPGDRLIGVPSSGIHSNGLSLARKVLPTAEWEELLIPTEIYVSLLSELTEHRLITGAAHVTGGGLVANTQRVLPEGTAAHFTWDWDRPAIFQRIQECGSVEESEMRAAFNMGIGLVLVCDSDRAEQVLELCRRHGYTAQEVGTVEEKAVQGAAVEEADSVGPWGGRNRG